MSGFKYRTCVLSQTSAGEHEKIKANLEKVTEMFASANQGWSVTRQATRISNKDAHYAILSHTEGASLCVCLSAYNDLPEIPALKANNYEVIFDIGGTSNQRKGLWFMYLPPSSGQSFGDNPLDASFYPVSALPIVQDGEGGYTVYAGHAVVPSECHMGIKGDTFWMYNKIDTSKSSPKQNLFAVGRLIDDIENDTGNVANRYAVLGSCSSLSSDFPSSGMKAAFYREKDGKNGLRPRSNRSKQKAVGKTYNLLQDPRLHIPSVTNTVRSGHILLHTESDDTVTEGVIPGSAVRGSIDKNIVRAVNARDLSHGQLIDGGDMIYIGMGCAFGWDAENPEFGKIIGG